MEFGTDIYLRGGTNTKLNTVRQYNQFVIGNNFTIFRLGVNGSPNVDIGVSARARERRLPLPINKKFSIASLFKRVVEESESLVMKYVYVVINELIT